MSGKPAIFPGLLLFFWPRYNVAMFDKFNTIYDMLWDTNFENIRHGEIEVDWFISNPGADQRRGLTLIFRPPDTVKKAIRSILDEIRQFEPNQYFYCDSCLHFTVLSLFSATVDHKQEYDRLSSYQAAVDEAIKGISGFTFTLKGLTVSKSAVILCGYPDPDNLNILRDRLRRNLIHMGLSQGLDVRYTLTAAHTTIVRFAALLNDPARLGKFLLENKEREVGSFVVDELQLVKNDWYMTHRNTTLVDQYWLNTGNIS